MHGPLTQICEIKVPWLGWHLFTLWHKDPEKDGSDDSCGWFMRSRHGDERVLEKIIKRFEFDWDRTFTSESGNVYWCGLFNPSGYPNFSVSGIALNLFFEAAFAVFRTRHKADAFMQKNLFKILLFSENPVDSLHDSFTHKFGKDQSREEYIRAAASCIYAWILRENRPWYRHPRWHIWHWRIQWPFGQRIWRWAFRPCVVCRKRIAVNDFNVISNWYGTSLWHHSCDASLRNQNEKSNHSTPDCCSTNDSDSKRKQ